MNKSVQFLAIVICVLFAASCNKEFGTTNAKWIHASPDAPALEVYNNGKQVLVNFNYTDVSDYINVDRGNLSFQVKLNSEIVARVSNPIWDVDGFYSVYLVDSFGAINRLLLNDAHSTPDGGKAQIRFLHLVPDLPQVKLIANGVTWFDEREFNFANQAFAEFVSVDAGNYTFTLRKEETTIFTDYQLAGNVLLEAGKTYTLYAKGFVDSTAANQLSLGVVEEK